LHLVGDLFELYDDARIYKPEIYVYTYTVSLVYCLI